MRTNEVLIKFLKDRRKKVGKTQAEMATGLGMNSIQGYVPYESRGYLPRDLARQEKLAELLGVTRQELLDKAGMPTEEQPNLVPLIQALAKTNCSVVLLDDIEFLIETQAGLEQSMSSALIEELMKHRAASSNGSTPPR